VIKRLFLSIVVACLAGCTSVSMRKAPSLDLSRFQRIFVVQPFNENHHLDEFFVAELRAAGRTASSGPLTMMPEDTEAVLTYDSRWTWDFTTYMIDLNVELFTSHTKKKLAEARYYQPTARPKPPEVAVHAIVAQLFPSAK
jgi:hypothetical protein